MSKFFIGFFVLFVVMAGLMITGVEAKTKSLHDVEGDRVIVLNIDRRAKLPKNYLKGRKAKEYIGTLDDLKQRLIENGYTSENAIRHSASSRFQNLSDGLIFVTSGGKIGYETRRDGAFTVIIDYPTGRKLEAVTDDLFDNYTNIINDDCPVPYVFFDKDGEESAILYLPSTMFVYQYVTKEGRVAIEVRERY